LKPSSWKEEPRSGGHGVHTIGKARFHLPDTVGRNRTPYLDIKEVRKMRNLTWSSSILHRQRVSSSDHTVRVLPT
jgi:hypothetical protein